MDVVTCAQAFHWFDKQKTKKVQQTMTEKKMFVAYLLENLLTSLFAVLLHAIEFTFAVIFFCQYYKTTRTGISTNSQRRWSSSIAVERASSQ